MKKIVLLSALILLVASVNADARIRIKGRGAAMQFDPASFPPNLQASLQLMNRKCVKCHTMERTVIAVLTGRAPITGQRFERQAVKAYGIKMLRKPNSGMNKQDIREVVVLLNYILEQNSKW